MQIVKTNAPPASGLLGDESDKKESTGAETDATPSDAAMQPLPKHTSLLGRSAGRTLMKQLEGGQVPALTNALPGLATTKMFLGTGEEKIAAVKELVNHSHTVIGYKGLTVNGEIRNWGNRPLTRPGFS